MRFRGTAPIAAVVCLAGVAGSQDQSGRTVIRTETRVVLVDTIVTDKKGSYVHDLSAKDFRVWEDNKEQTIASASLQSGAATPDEKNYMALLFDNTSMDVTGQRNAKLALAGFFDGEDAAQRLTAVAVFNGTLRISQNFTSDADLLKRAVANVPPPIPRMGSNPGALGDIGDVAPPTFGVTMPTQARGPSFPGSIEAEEQMARAFLFALGTLAKNMAAVPGRKALVLLTGGLTISSQAVGDLDAAINACNKANVAVYPIDVRGLRPSRGALNGEPAGAWAGLMRRTGAAFAAWPVPGAAAFQTAPRTDPQQPPRGQVNPGTAPGGSSTPTFPTTPPASSIPSTPSRPPGNALPGSNNNPAVGRPPGSGGPTMTNPGLLRDMKMDSLQVLSALATDTGGFVIRNSNDLLVGLRRIAGEQREYYMVTYSPGESSKGACHSLRVKVARGGTEVRSRSSYCFAKPVDILAGTPAERDLEGRMAAGQPGPAPGPAASMQAPFFYTGPNTARVNLAMELPAAGIRFEKVKGKLHAEVNVLAIAYRPEGEVAARFSDNVKLDFDSQGEVDAFALKPLHYENQFELAPGQFHLKVAFGQTGGAIGTLESPLVVDPYDGRQFGISALALSKEARQAPQADPNLQLAIMEGRSPLLARGILYTPSGGNRFRQGEAVRVYVELYDPQLLSGSPEVKLRVIMIDKTTGAQLGNSDLGNVSAFARPGTNVIPLGFTVPARPPGASRVEIQASSSGGGSATRAADFEVN